MLISNHIDLKTRSLRVLRAYYNFSRSVSIMEILTFGLIFYGISIFLNRPSSINGIFGTMEKITGVQEEAWATIIVTSVIFLRLNLNLIFQLIGAAALIVVMSFMWWVVWHAGLAWQGVVTYSLCVLVCIKGAEEDMIAHILTKQGVV